MIVLYRLSTLNIEYVTPGSDSGLFTNIDTNKPVGTFAFITTDVLATIEDSNNFYVTESAPSVPTGVAEKRIIKVTPTTNPIELNELSALNIQLRNAADTGNISEAIALTIVSDNGFISKVSLTTNGSGVGQLVFKSNKFTGLVLIRFYGNTLKQTTTSITINAPTSADQQASVEANDLQIEAVSQSKISNKQLIRVPQFASLWHANKPRVVQTFNPGLYSKMNTIVADDMGFIYVNGFQTIAENDPAVVKLNKDTGAVIATKPYTNYNLTSRFDGMCYDGTNIWVAGAHHLYKIDALDMTTMVDYTPGATADGNFQFLLWDGEFIWTQLRGGTHADADKIWKINPDGTVAATIDYRSTDPIGTAVRDIKQAAADEDYIYVTGAVNDVADWVRIKRSDSSLTYRNEGDLHGSFGIAVAEYLHHVYIGGGAAGGEIQILLDDTDNTPHTILANFSFPQCYDLAFDGRYLWAIASSGTGSAPRRYVRKVFNDFGTGLSEKDSMDLTVALDPTTLTFAPPHLYVAGFGSGTDSRIKKIFVGN